MIKAFKKVGVERTKRKLIKAFCDKPTANVILNDEKLKIIPLR